ASIRTSKLWLASRRSTITRVVRRSPAWMASGLPACWRLRLASLCSPGGASGAAIFVWPGKASGAGPSPGERLGTDANGELFLDRQRPTTRLARRLQPVRMEEFLPEWRLTDVAGSPTLTGLPK